MPAESRSTARAIESYLGRISGPLLDRIDMHVEVPAVRFRELTSASVGESSVAIRERVVAARRRQQLRYRDRPRITCNARMGSKEVKNYCALDETAMELLKNAIEDMEFSARAYDRILKVGRTIADLAGSDQIGSDHISDAVQLRSLDRQIWR
jgi:magnesium chelatase family protein